MRGTVILSKSQPVTFNILQPVAGKLFRSSKAKRDKANILVNSILKEFVLTGKKNSFALSQQKLYNEAQKTGLTEELLLEIASEKE